MVGEGFLKNLCGCAEGNTQSLQGQVLSCTVPLGTVVFFTFLGTTTTHQIVSTGSPSFPSSAPIEPDNNGQVWTVQPSAAGSYTYDDAFSPGVSGVIVVQ